MGCSKCGIENREGRKFCADCGAPIAAKCQQCGATNEPGARFCGECGTTLGGDTAGASPRPPHVETTAPEISITRKPPDDATPPEGERKIVSAVFADLKGACAHKANQRASAAASWSFIGLVTLYFSNPSVYGAHVLVAGLEIRDCDG
jgi:hypothetical protein